MINDKKNRQQPIMTRSHERHKDENQINIHVLVWKPRIRS